MTAIRFSSLNFPECIRSVLLECEGDSAAEFHDDAYYRLMGAGFRVEREYPVNDRGDGKAGRVDLVVRGPCGLIGIEIDRKTPRAKSRFKLRENFTWFCVLCRE
jgi:hypothetical protein